MRKFDAIIIGAGQAGPPLAGRLTRAGMSVALIERHLFGGTCVNTGCMPTKTLIASAYAAHMASRAIDFGVVLDAPIRVDMARVKARADAVVTNSRNNIEKWLRSMPGCTVVAGHARFEEPHTLRVGAELLSAPRIFINVGGRAAVPKMPGVGTVPYLTNSSIVTLDYVPEHLVIVGGSYVGLEFAQMQRRFGASVTIVEKEQRLIPHEDEDVSAAIKDILMREGIVVRCNARCISLATHERGVAVSVDCVEGETRVVGPHVLLAVGRRLLIGTRLMSNVARAIEKGETQGFMKVVVDAETRKILGAAILGTGGDEAIHGVLDIMNAAVPYDVLERAVPIHPTVSELIPTMLSEMRLGRGRA